MYFFKWFKRRFLFIYTLFPNSSNAEFSKGEELRQFSVPKNVESHGVKHILILYFIITILISYLCVCASILTLKFCNNSCCIKILLTLKFEIHPEYFDSTMHGEGKTFKRLFCSTRTWISSGCVGQIPLYMVLNRIIADSHVC